MLDQPTSITLKRPDKIVAAIVAAVVIAALGTIAYVVLPYLIELATNTIVFGVELVVLALMAIVFLDKGTWTSIIYKWKNISRNIRRRVAADDPIGTLTTVITRFGEKMEEIQGHMDKASAAQKRQVNSITECKKKEAASDALARAARQQGQPEAVIERHAVAAARWAKAAEEMQPLAELLQQTKEKMQQAKDVCAVRLADMENQREVLRMKLEAMKAGQEAVRSFKRFFVANPDLEMMTLSVEEIERQSTEAEAEIDGFIMNITPLVETNNLQKQADALAAMDRFNQKFLGASTTDDQLVAATPEKVKVLR